MSKINHSARRGPDRPNYQTQSSQILPRSRIKLDQIKRSWENSLGFSRSRQEHTWKNMGKIMGQFLLISSDCGREQNLIWGKWNIRQNFGCLR